MNTADTIYQQVKELPEPLVQEILDFTEFVKLKWQTKLRVTSLVLPLATTPKAKSLLGIHKGQIQIRGDIIAPIDVTWKAQQ